MTRIEKCQDSPGNTPFVKIENIYAKLECCNPCGSVKDRIAVYIIEESERRGLLAPGTTIIEATSGNTGIAFSYFGTKKGYPVKIVMPRNMTEERQNLIKELGAELILCKEGDFAEAAAIRDQLAEEHGYFNPDQFSNPLNVECHQKTTGQEILERLSEEGVTPGAFVAGVGTGGTLMGVGKALREVFPELPIYAVEPEESAIMSGGEAGLHEIFGIGDGFIPPIAGDGKGGVHPDITGVVVVSSQEAKETAKLLREEHDCCVGISSGANFASARKLSEKYGPVVTVFADGYERYQTQGLKHAGRGRCKHETGRRRVTPHCKSGTGKSA